MLAEQASPPVPETSAEKIRRAVESAAWGQDFAAWKAARPEASCRVSRSDAHWYRAEDQWCYRCREQEGNLVLERSFYAFGLEEPFRCRLHQLRAWSAGGSTPAELEQAYRALRGYLTRNYGPGEEPQQVQEFGAAFWRQVRYWQTPELEFYLYLEAVEWDSPEPKRLGLLVRNQPLRRALEEDPLLNQILWRREEREKLAELLSETLGSSFPALPALLGREDLGEQQPEVRSVLQQLLEQASNAPSGQRPAYLLAADLLAGRILDIEPPSEKWPEASKQLYGLTFLWSPLGAAWSYANDLLYRVWESDPNSSWGEWAFVELLGMGWDGSGMCVEGTDQFRAVIEQGERFLVDYPETPHQAAVVLALAQAYETWWSLAQAAADDPYAEAGLYQEGSQQARERAIEYYEQLIEHSPGSGEAAYARRQLPRLRLGIDTNQRRFFCIFD